MLSLSNLSNLTALLATAPGPARPGLLQSLMPMILIFGIFYLLLIAPMRKKQKKHAEMIQALKNGDQVITNGGIHGTVVGVSDTIVQLRIADQVKIEISRNAIAAFQNAPES